MTLDGSVSAALDNFVKNSEDSIFILNESLGIEYVNPNASQLIGLEAKRAAERNFAEPVDGNVLEMLKGSLKSVFETGRAVSFENSFSSSGKKIWLDVRLSPIRNGGESVRGILGIARDITERMRIRDLISASKEKWLRAIDNMPYLLAVVDGSYRIERVNRLMADKLGISVRNAAGLTCYEQVHKTSEPPSYCPLAHSPNNGNANREFIRRVESSWKSQVTISPLLNRDERVIGCLYMGHQTEAGMNVGGVFRDKLEQQQALKELLGRSEQILYIQDKAGKYIFFDSNASETTPSIQILGKTPYDLFEPCVAAGILHRNDAVARTGVETEELTELSVSGKKFRFLDKISPMLGPSGNVRQIVTVSRKIEGRELNGEQQAPTRARLTGRETEVLRLIAAGMTNTQIAEKLDISGKTAETHRFRIMQKLDLHKTSKLVRYALQSGLLD